MPFALCKLPDEVLLLILESKFGNLRPADILTLSLASKTMMDIFFNEGDVVTKVNLRALSRVTYLIENLSDPINQFAISKKLERGEINDNDQSHLLKMLLEKRYKHALIIFEKLLINARRKGKYRTPQSLEKIFTTACIAGIEEIVRFMLENTEVSINCRSVWKNTPLIMAASLSLIHI